MKLGYFLFLCSITVQAMQEREFLPLLHDLQHSLDTLDHALVKKEKPQATPLAPHTTPPTPHKLSTPVQEQLSPVQQDFQQLINKISSLYWQALKPRKDIISTIIMFNTQDRHKILKGKSRKKGQNITKWSFLHSRKKNLLI